MDQMKDILDHSLNAKEVRRKSLSKLPYEEKVRIVVEMQKMQAPILRARGKVVKIWSVDTTSNIGRLR